MHSSITIANKILEIAREKNKTLTPMQLIKLVYLCHAWMLGLYGRHLIKEPIEAWQYGPVIRDLYNQIKKYKSNPVTGPIDQNTCNPANDTLDNQELDVINQVFEKYGNLTGIELSSLTHQNGSPWSVTWDAKEPVISNDLIENYYKTILSADEAEYA